MNKVVARIIGEAAEPESARDFIRRHAPKPQPNDRPGTDPEDADPEPDENTIAQMWHDDQQGEYVQIDDDGSAHFVAHGRAMEQIAPRGTDSDEVFALIKDWTDRSQYWPNIWQVNDHGNVTLYDCNGNDLGGLV